MDRNSSNASDIFSKYLSPLETQGEPSKSEKKRTLPPTLPKKQLSRIDEQVNSKEHFNSGNIQNSNNLRDAGGSGNQTENIYDCPTTFNPRQFNANYDGTIKDPHYKVVVDVEEVRGATKLTNLHSSANGEATKHELGITERNGNSIRNRTSRIASIRDIVGIRRVINTQESQNKDGTIDRYIYLDRGNTCCLRISFLICLIAIIVLFILVANNTSRLSSIEGECLF